MKNTETISIDLSISNDMKAYQEQLEKSKKDILDISCVPKNLIEVKKGFDDLYWNAVERRDQLLRLDKLKS